MKEQNKPISCEKPHSQALNIFQRIANRSISLLTPSSTLTKDKKKVQAKARGRESPGL